MTAELEVVAVGIASTVQDRGRPGNAHLGVPASGAVDRNLAALVNRLVGNDNAAAVIETCGGLVVRSNSPMLVATSQEMSPTSVAAGESVHVRGGGGRLWHYLAVRGGVDVAPVLGSRATDTLSGLGPPPLVVGARLPIGNDPATSVAADHAPLAQLASVVRVSPGPRLDWFDPASYERLLDHRLTVIDSSRIGVRLSGVVLSRRLVAELPSEGLLRGAIQVPPDSDPVMMLADHPTTGGYPVIAVVHPDDVVVVAQAAPGSSVRLIDA